jgi:nucleotide-binding universal stress UspA family protein
MLGVDFSGQRSCRSRLANEAAVFRSLTGTTVRTQPFTGLLVQPTFERFLNQNEFDLVVAVSPPRTGPLSHFTETLAERLVRMSTVPTLVLDQRAIANSDFEPRSILVPYDFMDESRAVLPVVRFLAHLFQTEFTFLFVYGIPHSGLNSVSRIWESPLGAPQCVERRFAQLMEFELENVNARLEKTFNWLPDQIITRAVSEPSDLVLMATGRELGATTQAVVRSGPCSSLVCRPKLVSKNRLHDDTRHLSEALV